MDTNPIETPAWPAPLAPDAAATPIAERAKRRWPSLAGSALAAFGCFLPWATASIAFGSVSANGMNGDGKVFLALVAGMVALALWTKRRWIDFLRSVLALVIVVDAIHIMSDLGSVGSKQVVVTIGAGLWVCLVGTVVAVAAPLWRR
jgi:hypothetical protein